MTNLMMTVALAAKGKAMRFLFNEEGEVNIVTTVVLIGIAVALAIFFGDKVQQLLETLFGSLTTKATGAIGTSY